MQADASRGNLCESIGEDRDRFLDGATPQQGVRKHCRPDRESKGGRALSESRRDATLSGMCRNFGLS
jgi:hypothetical protein